MIRANEGRVEISGSLPTILAELSTVVDAMNEMLSEKHGEKTAREFIEKAFERGFMTEKELLAEGAELFAMFNELEVKLPDELIEDLKDLVKTLKQES